ncbi:MAG: response regulator transcription factor [Clostridia bacterium]|nr:response regulator transcription factor [Clostridia bacterium]
MGTILVIDDEKKIRDLVKMYLIKEGFQVDEAENGNIAFEKIKKNEYSLIILDLMLPGIDGFTLFKEIRKIGDVPVIMLTARGEEFDRVLGFEMGADDYVVKPFSPRELIGRVKALLRRSSNNDKDKLSLLQFDGLSIDKTTRKVLVEGQEVFLTPKEYELLLYLTSSPGQVFSREQIMQAVWNYDFFGDFRTVDTHIKNLREKLGSNAGKKYVHTVWGVGYKFEVRT